MNRNKFMPGDRVWSRNSGWDGVQYIVIESSNVPPDFDLLVRSMSSGRLRHFSEQQMVRCTDPKIGVWEASAS